MSLRADIAQSEWRKKLQPASFRGVGFFVESHESTFGRRVVVHEYPLRDDPYAEDLGRRKREFQVEAYVLGGDYMALRDALIAACETAGPAALVHPYLGTKTVVAIECRPRESTKEGGMARFTLAFVETGERLQPTAAPDTAAGVGAAADAAQAAIEAEMSGDFTVDDMPEFVGASAVAQLEDAIADIRRIGSRVASVASPFTKFSAQLDRLKGALSTAIRSPANLARDVVGAVVAVAGVATGTQAALSGYRSLWSFGSSAPAVPQTTSTRKQEATNQQAVRDLVQRAAVIEACRASSQMDFASHNEAADVREELADRLDELAETASDDVYTALNDLRVAVVKDITARGADLVRIVSYTPQATLPALVVAYVLYEDASRDAEIVARNRIRHPGFVPGGRSLEVLADA